MKRQTYTPGIEECAVRIPIEAFGDYSSIWSAIQAIASKIGYTPETLRSWHKKHIDQTIPASVQATTFIIDVFARSTVNGLYKSEVIKYLKQSWNGVNDVELATLEWVDWFNRTRLHSTIGYMSPFEFEKRYYDNLNQLGEAA